MKFRNLLASEIECRVSTVSEKGCSLLLYKDARCDMNILDESNVIWQRDHKELKGNIYCGVSIWNEEIKQFITKWDAGAESYTEKVKGESSDSFKRACFNWGIGRELYTSPFIWVNAGDVNLTTKNNKKTTYDRFKVTYIAYENNVISALEVVNEKTKKVVYKFGKQSYGETKSNVNEESIKNKMCIYAKNKANAMPDVALRCIDQVVRHYKLNNVLDIEKHANKKEIMATYIDFCNEEKGLGL